jgi:hypothetical protein
MQQYFRDLLPISFSYAVNGNIRGLSLTTGGRCPEPG